MTVVEVKFIYAPVLKIQEIVVTLRSQRSGAFGHLASNV
jgi:hypothetical protein